ncbi:hypothetical protein BD770DRAFT_439725 [Pilaira anomala]|nr:hypothetical protein BD770DRAFT_439725 [Pilaira anomala]
MTEDCPHLENLSLWRRPESLEITRIKPNTIIKPRSLNKLSINWRDTDRSLKVAYERYDTADSLIGMNGISRVIALCPLLQALELHTPIHKSLSKNTVQFKQTHVKILTITNITHPVDSIDHLEYLSLNLPNIKCLQLSYSWSWMYPRALVDGMKKLITIYIPNIFFDQNHLE